MRVELVLLRHADAGRRDPIRYPDDRLRPLTDRGRSIHATVARALRRLAVEFDHLLTSPLVRARQTAEITAEFVECQSAIREVSALGDEYAPGALLGALESYPPAARVGCVGHEPNLSEFATACLAANARPIIELPASGVVGLSFEGRVAFRGGRLRYLLRPEHLTALTEQDAAAS